MFPSSEALPPTTFVLEMNSIQRAVAVVLANEVLSVDSVHDLIMPASVIA